MAEQNTAEKRLAEEQKTTDKIKADGAAKLKGKPTPTQEENDLAALGGHVTEHEPDGSDPDPHVRQMEANKPAPYQTRQASGAPRERQSS